MVRMLAPDDRGDPVTDYLARKLAGCTYPGCTAEPLDNHCMCERHRDGHRERNKRWGLTRKIKRQVARVQQAWAW